MTSLAHPGGRGGELEQARESLAYWERRARTLPARAVRRRREAREMTLRWQERVAEAERAEYGRGLLGALLLVFAEHRMPQRARATSRTLARRAAQAAVAVVVLTVALAALGLYAAVELLGALL